MALLSLHLLLSVPMEDQAKEQVKRDVDVGIDVVAMLRIMSDGDSEDA